MWDDKINKKIKDAADQYHPAYDESAWDKMELLLNEQLPVKDDERKKYFFILLLLVFLGGSFFAIYEYNIYKNENLEQGPSKNVTQIIPSPGKKSNTNRSAHNSFKINANSRDGNNPATRSEKNNNNQTAGVAGNNSSIGNRENLFAGAKGKQRGKGYSKKIANTNAAEGENNDVLKSTTTPSEKDQYNGDQSAIVNPEKIITNANEPDAKKETAIVINDTANTKDILKPNVLKTGSHQKKSAKTNSKFSKNFAIDISAGPGISMASLDKAGKITVGYGVGLRYGLSSRFTLHTGFYIADKIYSANKNEYHLSSSAGYNNYLFNIDANCKVYEIPVTVSYSFGKTKNHQWFAGGGLSSYLMKKESYDYYYKYPSGYVYTNSWSTSNKNQHYFAVLDISAGYQYNFNKRLSLIGEPYLKIPMTGVGAGKVKLNSGGILFTLSVKPFYKK